MASSSSSDEGRDSSSSEDEDAPKGLIHLTASDTYFTLHRTRQPTSNNVFSHKHPPLSQEEYAEASPAAHSHSFNIPPLLEDPELYRRLAFELEEGFNLLFYGFGSKRQVLNTFGRDFCSRKGYVVVVNGFRPDCSIKAILNTIEESVPELKTSEGSSTTVDAQAKRIYANFSSSSSSKGKGKGKGKHQPPLYLIIHNIDSLPLRAPKAKSILSLLALCPSIHIAASIDHLNAPLLFSSQDSLARKQPPSPSSEIPSTRGFNWLWHDLTTLQPYDVETMYANRSSISGLSASHKKDALALTVVGAGITGGIMTETAALHILAAVTERANKLFTVMAERQIQLASSSPAKGGSEDMQAHAITYDMLYKVCRDEFIATNDSQLQAALGEFRDHGLVRSARGAGLTGELLWIPLRRERLGKVVESLKEVE